MMDGWTAKIIFSEMMDGQDEVINEYMDKMMMDR